MEDMTFSVTKTHTQTIIPASLSRQIGFIACIAPCHSGKRPQRYGIRVSVWAELWLAMISQIVPLPSPPSVSISHGWPHSSAPLASSGASLCNAGGFWFSGLYKKIAKGKGRCTERGCKQWHGCFFKPGAQGTSFAFFCHGLPPFRVKPCYLVESAP